MSALPPETVLCRICSDDSNPNNMVSPCNCKGTVEFVHPDCLSRWVGVSGKMECDLCKCVYERGFVGFKPLSQWEFPEALFAMNADNERFWERIYAMSYGIFAEFFLLHVIRRRGATAVFQLAIPAVTLTWWVSFTTAIVYYVPTIHDCILEDVARIKDFFQCNMIYEWKNKPKPIQ